MTHSRSLENCVTNLSSCAMGKRSLPRTAFQTEGNGSHFTSAGMGTVFCHFSSVNTVFIILGKRKGKEFSSEPIAGVNQEGQESMTHLLCLDPSIVTQVSWPQMVEGTSSECCRVSRILSFPT